MQEKIKIPVITRCGPAVKITKNGACIKNEHGVTTWSYSGKAVTGKGIYVAACARSGTMYIAKVLDALGYEIGHEQTAKDGSVGYHLAVIKPENCFHQVRHPLDQISSMYDYQSWGFMNQIIETHGRGLLGCMQYWLAWNELLESFCVWRYRLEDIDYVWPEFLERIGHEYVLIPDIPRDTNSRGRSNIDKEHSSFTWADLIRCNEVLARKIDDKAMIYGYSFPSGQSEPNESQAALVV